MKKKIDTSLNNNLFEWFMILKIDSLVKSFKGLVFLSFGSNIFFPFNWPEIIITSQNIILGMHLKVSLPIQIFSSLFSYPGNFCHCMLCLSFQDTPCLIFCRHQNSSILCSWSACLTAGRPFWHNAINWNFLCEFYGTTNVTFTWTLGIFGWTNQ